jgi:hypothetical protein
MHEWMETPAGWLKMDEVGNVIARHPYKYFNGGDLVIRAELRPDGSIKTAGIAPHRSFLYVHPDTGEIVAGGGTGFNREIELNGPAGEMVICKDGKQAVQIEHEAHHQCPDCGQIVNKAPEEIYPSDLFKEIELDVLEVDETDVIVRQTKTTRRLSAYRWNHQKKKLEAINVDELARPVRIKIANIKP